jgi:DNA-binding MarR family transcriptional regulator
VLTEAEYRALAEFRHALRIFLRFSEEAARGEGLTPNQHQLLLAIRGYPETRPPTITDVAELLQLQHHSVVELVDRAVDAQLVKRKVDREDRRRHRLTLTPKGSRILARLSESHRDELRRFRDEMGNVLRELSPQC